MREITPATESEHTFRIILEMPKPEYKVGDLFRVNQFHGRLVGSMVLLVDGVTHRGEWGWQSDTNWHVTPTDSCYRLILQLGERRDGAPLRPGIVFRSMNIADADEFACPVTDWAGPLWSADNAENVFERQDVFKLGLAHYLEWFWRDEKNRWRKEP